MPEVFDTKHEPQSQRMAFWLETVCDKILPVSIDPRHDAAPKATMQCATFGDLGLRDVVGGDHVYRRNERDIRRGDPETIQIGMPIGGSSILVQDGREAMLRGGDLVLYDSARPFSLVMEDRFRWLVFLLPNAKLRRSTAELQSLTAVRMSGDQGIPGVVSHFLRTVARDAVALESDPNAVALGENAADLIGTLVMSEFGRPWNVNDPDAVLRQRATAWVAQHLADRELAPERIAAALSVSVRRLHKLFEATGRTVMDHVREERLAAVRRDLVDPRLVDVPIAALAASHGMANAAAFSRSFRLQYGATPSDVRRQTAPAGG